MFSHWVYCSAERRGGGDKQRLKRYGAGPVEMIEVKSGTKLEGNGFPYGFHNVPEKSVWKLISPGRVGKFKSC